MFTGVEKYIYVLQKTLEIMNMLYPILFFDVSTTHLKLSETQFVCKPLKCLFFYKDTISEELRDSRFYLRDSLVLLFEERHLWQDTEKKPL